MKLKVKLVKSPIGYTKPQKDTVLALGLRKISDEKIHNDNPQIRGMIRKVSHLVEVSEFE